MAFSQRSFFFLLCAFGQKDRQFGTVISVSTLLSYRVLFPEIPADADKDASFDITCSSLQIYVIIYRKALVRNVFANTFLTWL